MKREGESAAPRQTRFVPLGCILKNTKSNGLLSRRCPGESTVCRYSVVSHFLLHPFSRSRRGIVRKQTIVHQRSGSNSGSYVRGLSTQAWLVSPNIAVFEEIVLLLADSIRTGFGRPVHSVDQYRKLITQSSILSFKASNLLFGGRLVATVGLAACRVCPSWFLYYGPPLFSFLNFFHCCSPPPLFIFYSQQKLAPYHGINPIGFRQRQLAPTFQFLR